MRRLELRCLLSLLYALAALESLGCGGPAFQAGEPSSTPPSDAGPSSTPSDVDPPSSSDGSPTPLLASDGGADAADALPWPDSAADVPDAPSAPLCVVVTPGYGCPAGFPYVTREAGVESCCNAL